MQSKLFDSELKVMGVLWREGDCTAKHISDAVSYTHLTLPTTERV